MRLAVGWGSARKRLLLDKAWAKLLDLLSLEPLIRQIALAGDLNKLSLTKVRPHCTALRRTSDNLGSLLATALGSLAIPQPNNTKLTIVSWLVLSMGSSRVLVQTSLIQTFTESEISLCC
jgi:hypothetical protein